MPAAVRVRHGRAHGAKQLQACRHVELVPVAVDINRLARDVLHHEVGQALFGASAVEQACDIGVVQGGQDLALLLEAAQHFLTAGLRAHNLESDLLAEGVVGAHGQVDGSHTALADFAEDLVGTDASPFQARRILRRDGQRGQQIGIVAMGGEQALDFDLQIGIACASLRQIRAARILRTFHDSLKKVANLAEAFRCHSVHVPNSGISG